MQSVEEVETHKLGLDEATNNFTNPLLQITKLTTHNTSSLAPEDEGLLQKLVKTFWIFTATDFSETS